MYGLECDVDEFRYGVNHCVTSLLNKNERKQNEYKEHINRLLHVIVNVCCEKHTTVKKKPFPFVIVRIIIHLRYLML